MVSRNHKANETTIFVCDRDAKSKRVKVADLLTLEEYVVIRDTEKASIELSNPKAVCGRLIELRDPQAIKELCDRLCEFLFADKYYEPKSRSNKLSPYSKLLRGIPDLVVGENAYIQTRQNGEEWTRHLYFQYCGLADTDWRDINAKATAKVIDRLRHQETIDADRYEQTISQLLNSNNEASIGAGLIAASGRRPVEVFLQGEFEADGDGLMFAGQAKKRADFPAYKIPLIGCTSDLWLVKLAEFRSGEICQKARLNQAKKGISIEDEVYAKAFTDAVRIAVDRKALKPAFSWLSKKSVSFSRLRDAYLSVAELRYKPDGVFGLFYQAELAGHEIAKAVSSMPTLNYQQFRAIEVRPIAQKLEKCPIDSVSAHTPKQNIELIIQKSGSPVNGRHDLDFYETPVWMTLLALANVPLSGTVGECCVGHGAIASIIEMAGLKIWTNDIDINKPADYHIDATNVNEWKSLPAADWIVTNPPYSDKSAPIIQAAYSHAKQGIVMLLRQDWDEGCGDRLAFLKAHPPTIKITVPRYCFRKGKNGKWATDDDPVCIYVWDKKAKMQGFTRPIWLGAEDISLYHRTPDTAPAIELVEAEVKRIIEAKKAAESDSYQKKTEEEIDEIMQAFIEYNKSLPRYRRWFISISIVEKCCQPIRREAAAKWHSENSSIISRMNQGLSLVHNRLRQFDWEFKQ